MPFHIIYLRLLSIRTGLLYPPYTVFVTLLCLDFMHISHRLQHFILPSSPTLHLHSHYHTYDSNTNKYIYISPKLSHWMYIGPKLPHCAEVKLKLLHCAYTAPKLRYVSLWLSGVKQNKRKEKPFFSAEVGSYHFEVWGAVVCCMFIFTRFVKVPHSLSWWASLGRFCHYNQGITPKSGVFSKSEREKSL